MDHQQNLSRLYSRNRIEIQYFRSNCVMPIEIDSIERLIVSAENFTHVKLLWNCEKTICSDCLRFRFIDGRMQSSSHKWNSTERIRFFRFLVFLLEIFSAWNHWRMSRKQTINGVYVPLTFATDIPNARQWEWCLHHAYFLFMATQRNRQTWRTTAICRSYSIVQVNSKCFTLCRLVLIPFELIDSRW